MRDELIELIKETIVFQYNLPNVEHAIERAKISSLKDRCYRCSSKDDLSKVIYNSIVDYSFNEFDLIEKDLKAALSQSLLRKIRFDEGDSEEVKLKYGFYGEVLLYCLLHVLFKAPPLISRGYFYDPTRKSETTGYDSYHLVENKNQIYLWWGEVKFHQKMKSAVNSAVGNIPKVLSSSYLKSNILAVLQHKSDLSNTNSLMHGILDSWSNQPDIIIHEEIKKHNLKLVYPIFLIFNKNKSDTYEDIIQKAIDEIDNNISSIDSDISYSLFFVLMPISYTKAVKKQVIEWIKSNEPLMS